MEVLGERWSLLVVRELMFGPMRFSAIRRELPGISARVLTERLATLEAAGVVRLRELPPPVNARAYGLTELGQAAAPVLRELVQWAMKSEGHNSTLPMTASAFMQSLQFSLQRGAARAVEGMVVELRIGPHSFAGRIGRDGFVAERREAPEADIAISAENANAMLGVFYGRAPLGYWLDGSDARRLTGDRERFEQFRAAFAWPAKLGGPRTASS